MIQCQIPFLMLTLMIQLCCQPIFGAEDPESYNNTGVEMSWISIALSTSYCKEMVSNFSSLTDGLGFPEHLKREDAVKTGQDFDVIQYFTVLDRLSMEPGYVLDYVYYFGGIGGEPVLYARKADQSPYKNYSQLAQERKISSPLSEDEYMNHIQTDGTPESFFQLYMLRIMGGQFYLFWHANYDDFRIVCKSSDAALCLPNASSGTGLSQALSIPEIVAKASQMDFTPMVEMNNDSVRVSAVVFTNWGGFIRRSVAFRREFPHMILSEDSKVYVPYDCGIVF